MKIMMVFGGVTYLSVSLRLLRPVDNARHVRTPLPSLLGRQAAVECRIDRPPVAAFAAAAGHNNMPVAGLSGQQGQPPAGPWPAAEQEQQRRRLVAVGDNIVVVASVAVAERPPVVGCEPVVEHIKVAAAAV